MPIRRPRLRLVSITTMTVVLGGCASMVNDASGFRSSYQVVEVTSEPAGLDFGNGSAYNLTPRVSVRLTPSATR